MSFRKHKPISESAIRARDAFRLGLSRQQLVAMVDDGSWERLGRGLYAPVGSEPIPWQHLHEVQLYAPRVVFCLETALAFHGMSDVVPRAIWLSIARGMRRPTIRWVPTELITIAPDLWELGIESEPTIGGPLRVTSVCRTIVDCFRFRRRIGLETALHALKDARSSDRVSPNDLIEMARRFRQERVMLPYVEAIG